MRRANTEKINFDQNNREDFISFLSETTEIHKESVKKPFNHLRKVCLGMKKMKTEDEVKQELQNSNSGSDSDSEVPLKIKKAKSQVWRPAGHGSPLFMQNLHCRKSNRSNLTKTTRKLPWNRRQMRSKLDWRLDVTARRVVFSEWTRKWSTNTG